MQIIVMKTVYVCVCVAYVYMLYVCVMCIGVLYVSVCLRVAKLSWWIERYSESFHVQDMLHL